MKTRVPVVAAILVLALAAWLFLPREGPSGFPEDSHAVNVHDLQAASAASSPRLAPAPEMAREPTPAPSSSPTAGGVSPRPPALPARPPITGTARVPTGEKASSWVVTWRRAGSPTGGTVAIRDDGSFELPGSDSGAYLVSLRPKTALWPSITSSKGTTMAATGMVLEPEALSAFRVRVEGALPSDLPTPVQVHSLEDLPILKLTASADQPDVDVVGIEDQHIYNIYIGPTSDGRYGVWQGRPQAGESVAVSLRTGSTLRGRIDGGDDIVPTSRRLAIHAFVGADVDVPVSESGTFEQSGLEAGCLWKVVAIAQSKKGVDFRAETIWRPDSSELVLMLETVKK